nr:hypothetical protein [Nitrosomonas eutropha]
MTAPAGAGKTTVLDVICLALYGRALLASIKLPSAKMKSCRDRRVNVLLKYSLPPSPGTSAVI